MTFSPQEDLMLAIVAIHGGRIRQEELHTEVEAWKQKYGLPTREKITHWKAQHQMELGFGLAKIPS